MPNGSFVDDYLLGQRLKSGRKKYGGGRAFQARVWRNWICCGGGVFLEPKLSFNHPKVNRKGGVIDIHFPFGTSFTGLRTPWPRETHLESCKMALTDDEGSKDTKKYMSKPKAPNLWLRCYLPLLSPFLWAFLTEVAWGLILVCECGRWWGERMFKMPGMGI